MEWYWHDAVVSTYACIILPQDLLADARGEVGSVRHNVKSPVERVVC